MQGLTAEQTHQHWVMWKDQWAGSLNELHWTIKSAINLCEFGQVTWPLSLSLGIYMLRRYYCCPAQTPSYAFYHSGHQFPYLLLASLLLAATCPYIEDNLWLMASLASSLLTKVPGVYMSPTWHPKPLFSDRLIYWYGSQAALPSGWLYSEGVISSRTYAIAWAVIEISSLSLCLPFLFFSHFLTCFSREYFLKNHLHLNPPFRICFFRTLPTNCSKLNIQSS